ncbi:MAG: hypothetical protein Q8K79_22685 [Solirubrobacteraceae bacterium]|nr:hypothetical protein [Solirubrobacteraceae bacterium]
MLAVGETEQVQATPPSAKGGDRAAPERRRSAAPGTPMRALARCSIAGCSCGGTCGGHTPRDVSSAAADLVGKPVARRGELPLDATLARAVLARSSTSSRSSGSGGGGSGGGLPVAGSACKVDVRATHIGGILSGMPIWHLFVVTTDGAGTERYYRGGPGGPGGGPTYGSIQTNDGLYVAGTVDWSPGAPSTTVLSGAAACGHDACLAAELRRIDGTRTAYAPTGPNSNTVAATILANCSIPRGKPVWVAPGWSDPAI